MKKTAAIFMTVLLCLSLTACGRVKEDTSKEQSDQMTEDTPETDNSSENDSSDEGDGISAENDSDNESNESAAESDSDNEHDEASSEFEIPMQTDFSAVDGLSGSYADLENRAFAYNGRVFTLGESTLKDLIDGGIPFKENDLNNKGNNVNSNYKTDTYTARINDYVTMQFTFINITEGAKTEEDCLLSNVLYFYLYVPQPDYDAELNKTVAENILDAADKVCFSFPATLTKEQLLEHDGEGAEQDERNNVNYEIDSEIYMGSSGYHFEFNDKTNQLERVSISWLP